MGRDLAHTPQDLDHFTGHRALELRLGLGRLNFSHDASQLTCLGGGSLRSITKIQISSAEISPGSAATKISVASNSGPGAKVRWAEEALSAETFMAAAVRWGGNR